MSPSRIETYTFSAPDGIDRTLLEWVARVAGRAAVVETASDKTHGSVTVQNNFCGGSTSQFANGLVGCVRLLATPELLLSDHGATGAVVESWLQITEATLLPLLRSEKQGTSFVSLYIRKLL